MPVQGLLDCRELGAHVATATVIVLCAVDEPKERLLIRCGAEDLRLAL